MEKRLGARLTKEALVATKLGTDLASSPPRKRFDAEYLRAALERSRDRLKRDKVDIVLLHNPSAASIEKGLETLASLVEAGLAKTYGVSVGNKDAAFAALKKDVPVLELAHNAFHQLELNAISVPAKEKGTGILARSVLAYGLLSGLWPNSKEFPAGDHRSERWTPEELRRRVGQLNALRPSVAGAVTSIRAVALRYVLTNELVSSAVLGPRKSAQLDQLVREAGKGPPYLTPESFAALERRLANVGIRA
jgi:aryl-alcohol dehydrogenase-like predicted oxidoreductase